MTSTEALQKAIQTLRMYADLEDSRGIAFDGTKPAQEALAAVVS